MLEISNISNDSSVTLFHNKLTFPFNKKLTHSCTFDNTKTFWWTCGLYIGQFQLSASDAESGTLLICLPAVWPPKLQLLFIVWKSEYLLLRLLLLSCGKADISSLFNSPLLTWCSFFNFYCFILIFGTITQSWTWRKFSYHHSWSIC